MLDAPGCMPYREVEEVSENGGTGSRVDRRVTRRALHVPDDCVEGVVLHGAPADLRRVHTTVPLDLSAVHAPRSMPATRAHGG